VRIWNWPHSWTARMPERSLIAITAIISVEKTTVQTDSLENYKAMIESLPVTKRAQLWKALRKINAYSNAYLLDIEASEEGEVIIETRENGAECFYAICTKKGDFKGTWLPDGSLMKHPWSADLLYSSPALSLT
jgi:hypothetical protein